MQALVRNVRTSFWMKREMTSGKHHEEELDWAPVLRQRLRLTFH